MQADLWAQRTLHASLISVLRTESGDILTWRWCKTDYITLCGLKCARACVWILQLLISDTL